MSERVEEPGSHSGVLHAVALIAIFAVVAAIGYVIVRPLTASPVGYDTAGSVLYFRHIIRGVLLEQQYGATPKPAMTVIDGLLYTIGGWRWISLGAVAVWAAVATLAAELLYRIAGVAASAFAAVALASSAALILDASLAYAVSWACLWLLLAAFALLAERPRYAIGGLLLALATLCRLEVIVIVTGAVGLLALATTLAPSFGRARPPAAAWLIALGFLAVPVMLVHDWLLIRDPLYWMQVSASYSAAHLESVRDPIGVVVWLAGHLTVRPTVVGLAIVSAFVLVVQRKWAVLIALALAGPGIAAFLVLLAARGTYVSNRYADIIDITLSMAAAVGFAALAVPVLDPASRRLGRRRRVVVAVVCLIAAVTIQAPLSLFDHGTRAGAARQRTVATNLSNVTPRIRAVISSESTGGARVIAPGLWASRLIVDLDGTIQDVVPATYSPGGDGYADGLLRPGQIVYYDKAAEPESPLGPRLEARGPVTFGSLTLAPLASDRVAGWWLFRVEPTTR